MINNISVPDNSILFKSGFAYTAIALGGKGPTSRGWNKNKNAIIREEDAWQLSGNNLGLLHAFSSPNTCALDLDKFEDTQAISTFSSEEL